MAKHRAVACLEESLRYTLEEIKAAEKALVDRKAAVEQTAKHLAGYYIDRDHLTEALALVKKRVGES